jgi:hypothetical protein
MSYISIVLAPPLVSSVFPPSASHTPPRRRLVRLASPPFPPTRAAALHRRIAAARPPLFCHPHTTSPPSARNRATAVRRPHTRHCTARAQPRPPPPPSAPSPARLAPPPCRRPRALHHTRASTPCTPSVRSFARTILLAVARSAASLLLSVIEMGREKRKGKEIVVEEPARKRTRAAREAERAEMVAKAAEEQASGHARPFMIRDPSARGKGRGRGMGRVRGARATRATTAAAAAESDQSLSAAESDSDTEQSEQSQGQGSQESPILRRSGRTRQTSPAGDTLPATERRTGPRTRGGHQP